MCSAVRSGGSVESKSSANFHNCNFNTAPLSGALHKAPPTDHTHLSTDNCTIMTLSSYLLEYNNYCYMYKHTTPLTNHLCWEGYHSHEKQERERERK